MIYGLTGGIATGKSTILNDLKKMGYKTIDLDDIAHKLLKDDSVKEEILENISKEILDKNNDIDRRKLANIVFSNKDKLEKLNKIMHEKIIKKMNDEILVCRNNNIDLVVEVPLLFELNLEKNFDKVILAYANSELQIDRIIKRDKKSRTEAINILNSQMDIEEKIKLSDIVINTTNNEYDLEKELKK